MVLFHVPAGTASVVSTSEALVIRVICDTAVSLGPREKYRERIRVR